MPKLHLSLKNIFKGWMISSVLLASSGRAAGIGIKNDDGDYCSIPGTTGAFSYESNLSEKTTAEALELPRPCNIIMMPDSKESAVTPPPTSSRGLSFRGKITDKMLAHPSLRLKKSDKEMYRKPDNVYNGLTTAMLAKNGEVLLIKREPGQTTDNYPFSHVGARDLADCIAVVFTIPSDKKGIRQFTRDGKDMLAVMHIFDQFKDISLLQQVLDSFAKQGVKNVDVGMYGGYNCENTQVNSKRVIAELRKYALNDANSAMDVRLTRYEVGKMSNGESASKQGPGNRVHFMVGPNNKIIDFPPEIINLPDAWINQRMVGGCGRTMYLNDFSAPMKVGNYIRTVHIVFTPDRKENCEGFLQDYIRESALPSDQKGISKWHQQNMNGTLPVKIKEEGLKIYERTKHIPYYYDSEIRLKHLSLKKIIWKVGKVKTITSGEEFFNLEATIDSKNSNVKNVLNRLKNNGKIKDYDYKPGDPTSVSLQVSLAQLPKLASTQQRGR
jgi:hypothetical protein